MICEICKCEINSYLNTPELADEIMSYAATFFNIKKELLSSKHRPQQLVDARFMTIAVIRQRVRLPVARIGKIFNRDHTSILHALRTVEDLCHTDPIYSDTFERFKIFINNQN